MKSDHLDLTQLTRFARQELANDEMLDVGWHLFLCSTCRDRLAEVGPGARSLFDQMFAGHQLTATAEGFSGLVTRVAEQLRLAGQRIEQERQIAPELANELARHPVRRQHWMVENAPRYQTYGLAEQLLTTCRRSWSDDPARAEELAELALTVAQHLDPKLHGESLLCDLQAEAWSYIANCRRIRSDLRLVTEAFEIAESFRLRGTLDSVEEAALLDLKASYLRDQRRFGEAAASLDRVIAIYREAADRHLVGRALIKKAKLLRDSGDTEGAIGPLEEARQLIDRKREPELVFYLENNLALYLSEVGRVEQAVAMLPDLRRLVRQVHNRLDRLRYAWVEGLVQQRAGQLALAEAALRRASKGFVAAGIGYDAALVLLDLAVLLLETDRIAETRELARQLVAIFTSRGVHRETIAALAIFQRAAEEETVTAALAREIHAYLQRARTNPMLRYEHRFTRP